MESREEEVVIIAAEEEDVSRPRKKTKRTLQLNNVLISGMGGVGAQVAKCLVHAGVKSLTLQDYRQVDWWDLSGNPFLTKADLGKNRASVCSNKLQLLNRQVEIHVLPSKLHNPHQLSNFQVVVFTDTSLNEAVAFDDYCHNHAPPIHFIMAEVRGLFGRVFCDFGPQFSCDIVESKDICKHDGRGLIHFKEDHPLILGTSNAFIQNTRSLPSECDQCKMDGFGRLGKKTKSLHFKPLKDAVKVKNPVDLISGANTNSVQQSPLVLHIAFQALDEFIQQRGCLPAPGSWDHNKQLCSLAAKMMKEVPTIDLEKEYHVLQHFASGSRAVIGPMASVFGGIVGHEILKALSRQSHPIFQFFYFDSLESLPSLDPVGDPLPRCSRYDAQTLLFGGVVQKKLERAKLLVVGDGILGCELMSNLALMGTCSGNDGTMAVTHRIPARSSPARSRISYIGRQYIFEDCYEEQCVPSIAIASALSINNNLNIHVLNQPLGPELEHVYEDAFWESLDTIVDATNDLRSIHRIADTSNHFLKSFSFPLISGAQSHSIVQLPHPKRWRTVFTKFPFVWRLPGSEEYLGCTRSEFEGLFVKTPKNVNMFLVDRDSFVSTLSLSADAQSKDILNRIIECLEVEWCQTFKDCVDWARMKFEIYFVDSAQLFLKSCEELNSDKGKKLIHQLAGCLKLPKPHVFSASDVDHQSFVRAASILRANTYGIEIPSVVDWVKEVERVKKQPKKRVIKASIPEPIDLLISRVEELVRKLPAGFHMNPIPFDIDDGDHMEFMTSMFNLFITSESPFELCEDRAKEVLKRCYPLPSATSYTVAAGLTCLKLYKLIGGTNEELKGLQNVESNLDSSFLFKSTVTKNGQLIQCKRG